jgi:GIY-YIG catalytic domain
VNLNKLLTEQRIDPSTVLVFRHRPTEARLNKVLPWLAAEKPQLFNAYQQTQSQKVEKAMQSMTGVGYVASFIGLDAGKAHFVGLYSIEKCRPLSHEEFWKVPENSKLKEFDMHDWFIKGERETILWFDLVEKKDFCSGWKGKLIVTWPPPELSWWRRAHRNEMSVHAILEDSAFNAAIPAWDSIELRWEELAVLATNWRMELSKSRGIYYIFDESDGKAYVGSAAGKDNLLGRWQNYAKTEHGGNKHLRGRDPRNFRFSILQRVSPDMEIKDIVQLEASWKCRLHTRHPLGLNDN